MSEAPTPAEPQVQEPVHKSWLHYIGVGLYGKDRFCREAKRLGINRSVQYSVLQRMHFGDIVMLAEYQSHEIANGEREGDAIVFGYFRVTGMSQNLPGELKEELHDKLNIVGTIPPMGKIERECGSYEMAGGLYIEDSLEDIMGYVDEILGKHKLTPFKFKWFVTGTIVQLPKPIILRGQNFFRGYKEVKIAGALKEVEGERHEVVFIYDYSKRAYIKKDDRDRLDKMMTDEYDATTGKEADE